VALINEIAMYVYLIYSFISGSLSIGEFTMYVIAIRTFCNIFTELITSLARISYLSSGIGIIRDFLDYTSDDSLKPLIDAPKDTPFTIEFVNVFFKYPHQEDFVLKNINIRIDGLEKLALVGVNGAGKTTFIKLLMGLYLPTSGEILINGISTASIERKALYRLFSVVFQEAELFAMTLAENISMCPHTETDMQRAENCINYVGLSDMLDKLPDKMKAMVTKNIFEGGVDFSGGQKQRLAIARALYKDRTILILDEPTAALDAFAENEIYNLFSNMTIGKTCVFISHRLSSVIFCDKVLLLDNGIIAEYGTHDSLMQSRGKYHEMFSQQAKYYVDEAKGGKGR
jgi:ABC-type bacteriocin/lantibiotic exporter with double-glycine peptidase domain